MKGISVSGIVFYSRSKCRMLSTRTTSAPSSFAFFFFFSFSFVDVTCCIKWIMCEVERFSFSSCCLRRLFVFPMQCQRHKVRTRRCEWMWTKEGIKISKQRRKKKNGRARREKKKEKGKHLVNYMFLSSSAMCQCRKRSFFQFLVCGYQMFSVTRFLKTIFIRSLTQFIVSFPIPFAFAVLSFRRAAVVVIALEAIATCLRIRNVRNKLFLVFLDIFLCVVVAFFRLPIHSLS